MSYISENMNLGQSQQSLLDGLKKVFVEQDLALLKSESQKLDLKKALDQSEAQKKELMIELEERLNEKRETQSDLEKIEIQWQKLNEKAELETKKADELVFLLGEERKRLEKENNILHGKVNELEEQLAVKKKNIDELEEQTKIKETLIKEKEDELEDMEALNQVLIVEGNYKNTELQDTRRALITGLKEMSSRSSRTIGVKTMGDLDKKPFVAAAKRVYTSRNYGKRAANEMATELCSVWEQYLRDPNWHPFIIITDTAGKTLEIVDDNDERLMELKREFGDEVLELVKTSLSELNEYNPSGRYPVPELWNFIENRKAMSSEGVAHLLNKMKPSMRRNKRRNVAPTKCKGLAD